MATFVIGDIQGCYDAFRRLLEKIEFDPATDRLWLTGDLVNRGPASLATLRFVRNLGDRAITVLGNHDLALLVAAEGHRELRERDTVADILDAPDRDELLDWVRHQPLAHYDPALDCLMVHAGLPPQWDIETTLACANEVETILQSPMHEELLARMFGDQPDLWSPELVGFDRWRFSINALTRLRYVTADGRLDFSSKDAPGSQPGGLTPWYEAAGRASAGQRIVFGHWSTLGQLEQPLTPPEIHALDTGCLWGGKLTALRIDLPVGAHDARQSVECNKEGVSP